MIAGVAELDRMSLLVELCFTSQLATFPSFEVCMLLQWHSSWGEFWNINYGPPSCDKLASINICGFSAFVPDNQLVSPKMTGFWLWDPPGAYHLHSRAGKSCPESGGGWVHQGNPQPESSCSCCVSKVGILVSSLLWTTSRPHMFWDLPNSGGSWDHQGSAEDRIPGVSRAFSGGVQCRFTSPG